MTSDVLPARPPQRPKVSGTLLAGIAIVAVLLVVLGVFVFRGGGSAEAVAVPDVVGGQPGPGGPEAPGGAAEPGRDGCRDGQRAGGYRALDDAGGGREGPPGDRVALTVSSGLASTKGTG
jgi:hypothetical protein